MTLCFVFSLYKGLSGYTRCLQEKISRFKLTYPDATFVVISDMDTAKACAKYIDEDVIWRIYNMKRRTANRGMASFARFTVIFDADFQEQTVVLLDVHDDAETQLSYVKAACKSLVHKGKEAYFMYVKSDDTSCEYECSVHKTMHLSLIHI